MDDSQSPPRHMARCIPCDSIGWAVPPNDFVWNGKWSTVCGLGLQIYTRLWPFGFHQSPSAFRLSPYYMF